MSNTEVRTSQPLFLNTFILRNLESPFADITKIAIMLIKIIFKDSIKHKKIKAYAKGDVIAIFWTFFRQGIILPSFNILE